MYFRSCLQTCIITEMRSARSNEKNRLRRRLGGHWIKKNKPNTESAQANRYLINFLCTLLLYFYFNSVTLSCMCRTEPLHVVRVPVCRHWRVARKVETSLVSSTRVFAIRPNFHSVQKKSILFRSLVFFPKHFFFILLCLKLETYTRARVEPWTVAWCVCILVRVTKYVIVVVV